MTHPLAALIAGVQRWRPEYPGAMVPSPNGVWVDHRHVLAALEAVPVPDPVEAGKVLEGVTPGRVVQFHPSFCKEAEDAPFSEWDTSHDLSVIQPDGKRYRIGSMRHADDANFFQWCANNAPALIALATAQAAQIAGLRQAVTDADNDVILAHEARKEAQAQAATLRAEVERLRGALQAAEAWIVDGGHVDDDDVRNGETGARRVYEQVRAALEDGKC